VPPPVSLILPNRNNAPVLELVLRRLAEHTTYSDVELIVVDDGSDDGSVEILRGWRGGGPELTLVEQPAAGAIAALNTALEHARGELIVQLDGDATVETPGWLERMVGFLEAEPRAGVVSAGVVFDNGRIHAYGVDVVTPDGLHDRGTRIAEPRGRRTLHTRVHRPRPRDCPEARAVAEVDASVGVCMLYPRALAQEIGGYDAGFSPVWFDDLDLSLSARRLGRKVFVLPEVEVLHRSSLRNPREGGARAAAARRALGRAVPQPVKDTAIAALRLDRPTPAQRERLRHHYAYWREKWGWDLLNPNVEAIRRRWGETEVCWRYEAPSPR
jgi:O-antigen biosynthesis protein